MSFEIRDLDNPAENPVERPPEKEPDTSLYQDLALFQTPTEPVEPEAPDAPTQLSLVPPPEPTVQEQGEALGMDPDNAATLDEMLTPNPVESIGLDDAATFLTLVRGSGLNPDLIDEKFVADMEAAGVTGPAEVTRYLSAVAGHVAEQERVQSERDRLDAIEAAVLEQRERGPGSPLDDRLARIESMLTEQRESVEAIEREQRFVQERSPLQASAMDLLINEARRRGIEAPDFEVAAQTGAQLLHLDPQTAAKVAWIAGGGDPGVFGERPTRRTQEVVRSSEKIFVVPTGSTAGGRKMTAEELYGGDDGLQEWTG